MECRPYRAFGCVAGGHESANEMVPPHDGGDERHVVNLTSNHVFFHLISLLAVVKTELLAIRTPHTIQPTDERYGKLSAEYRLSGESLEDF